MGKVLDLSVYEDSTFDLTLLNGDILTVRKPNEATLLKIMSIEKVLKSGDNERILKEMVAFLKSALSNNKEGVVVDDKWFDENDLDLGKQLVVFRAYVEFAQELLADPNLQSPLAE